MFDWEYLGGFCVCVGVCVCVFKSIAERQCLWAKSLEPNVDDDGDCGDGGAGGCGGAGGGG